MNSVYMTNYCGFILVMVHLQFVNSIWKLMVTSSVLGLKDDKLMNGANRHEN